MDPMAEELIVRLQRNPEDGDAYAALRAHYRDRRDYASLANLLDGWAERAGDRQAAAQAFFEAGEIVRSYLGDRGRAITLYQRSLTRDPVYLESSRRLQGIFEEVGDTRRLLEVLEQRAEALSRAAADPRHVAHVHQEIGQVWEQRMRRVDKAVSHYRKAFELDPSLVTAIYAAREIYRNAGNHKAAASLYELEANAESDPLRKVALWRELGHFRAGELRDLEGALLAMRRAISLAPHDLGALHDLATKLLDHAAQARDPAIADAERRQAADLFYQLAQSVSREHALAYALGALDAVPDHDGALELVEMLAPDGGRDAMLAPRWVSYLQYAPQGPLSDTIRRKLGAAYVDAGQIEDAIACFEPLLERGDPQAAEMLVDLYRSADREADLLKALSIAMAGLPPAERVPRLREIVDILESQGKSEDAVARCREILAIAPDDPAAIATVEEWCREHGEFTTLREHLLAAARVPSAPVEVRKAQLWEVARLSEQHLDDTAAAVSALRAIVSLDPSDREARKALAEALERSERWDELAQLLERDALSVTDPNEKGVIYLRLARLHRDRRQSFDEAIRAYHTIRELTPDDPTVRDELSDVLIDAGAFLEAMPLLRERVESASKETRAPLLRRVGAILEEQLDDSESAFIAMTRLLDDEPGDLEALARMERIDRQSERWDRLVETLGYRAEVAAPEERARVFGEMGEISETRLGDLERAAEYYVKAVDQNPGDQDVLDRLCRVYDQSERYRDLVVLLKERAKNEANVSARSELYRRIARTLADRVRNEDGAAEAWQEVLKAGNDEEALRALRIHSDRHDDPERLAEYLGRLAVVTGDRDEAKALSVERAQLLADRLDRPREAIDVLKDVLRDPDDPFPPALSLLVALAEKTNDLASLAGALELQLRHTEDDGLRVPVARRLSDLYEGPLGERERAIVALKAWADADLMEPEPVERLVPLYESTNRTADLVSALDTLAGIVQERERQTDLVLRAAELAYDRLGDVDGAWVRLSERVDEGDDRAEAALRDLSQRSGRAEQLADLFVRLAQKATDVQGQKRRWLDGSRVYEEQLGDRPRALEATLRAFALDLGDRGCLDEVDRLAGLTQAWERLNQVYEALIRKAEHEPDRVLLLTRQARLLAERANDPSSGLDRALRAASLVPDDDEVLALAEALAPLAGRADELLIVYDRRKGRARDDAGRVEALLRGVRLSVSILQNRDLAMPYIAQAVALSLRSPNLDDAIERTMKELDRGSEEHPNLRWLVQVYEELGQRAIEEDPLDAAELYVRSARIVCDELGEEPRAYETLKRASLHAPRRKEILEALVELARRLRRLDDLDRHFANTIEEALDQDTTVTLLAQRATVLEIELNRYSDAAEVWNRLLVLRSDHEIAFEHLATCLRKAGRYQDLLMVLERRVARTPERNERIALLRSIAATWENDVGNKWEALDAWRKIAGLEPDAADAKEAIERLAKASRSAEDSSSVEIDVPSRADEGPAGELSGLGRSLPDRARLDRARLDHSGFDHSGLDPSGEERDLSDEIEEVSAELEPPPRPPVSLASLFDGVDDDPSSPFVDPIPPMETKRLADVELAPAFTPPPVLDDEPIVSSPMPRPPMELPTEGTKRLSSDELHAIESGPSAGALGRPVAPPPAFGIPGSSPSENTGEFTDPGIESPDDDPFSRRAEARPSDRPRSDPDRTPLPGSGGTVNFDDETRDGDESDWPRYGAGSPLVPVDSDLEPAIAPAAKESTGELGEGDLFLAFDESGESLSLDSDVEILDPEEAIEELDAVEFVEDEASSSEPQSSEGRALRTSVPPPLPPRPPEK
jgi:tetratricopeptide (TPR) repeat protein